MKAIVNPVDYAESAVEAYRALYGTDLVSVVLYGSAAGGDFDPRQSDINMLIVLSAMGCGLIAKSAALQEKLSRQRFARPLFMDKAYIADSCDSYPMEFLDMKGCYRVLFGEDVFMSIDPKIEDLRLQVERELKGKWLHLLREYTFARKNKKRLLQLTRLSLKAFSPVFRALLKLKDAPVPSSRKELFEAVESAYSLVDGPFQAIAESCAAEHSGLEPRFVAYADAVKSIIDAIENK